MKKSPLGILILLCITVTGFASESPAVSASASHAPFKQQDLDTLADQLCDPYNNMLLSRNDKSSEFFGRLIGIDQIKQLSLNSLDEFIESNRTLVDAMLQRQMDRQYETCKAEAKAISCDETVSSLKQIRYEGYFGLDADNLEDKLRNAMSQMNIQTCAVIDVYFRIPGKDEDRHNQFFVSDFGTGPQIFSQIDMDKLGQGPTVFKFGDTAEPSPDTLSKEDQLIIQTEPGEYYADASGIVSGADTPQGVAGMLCKLMTDGDMRIFLEVWPRECIETIAEQSYRDGECGDTLNLVDCLRDEFSQIYESVKDIMLDESRMCEVISVNEKQCTEDDFKAVSECGIDAVETCSKVKLKTNSLDNALDNESNLELISIKLKNKWYLVTPDFFCDLDDAECEDE